MTATLAPPLPDRLVPDVARGQTVVCVAPGPSLTAADVARVRGRAHVLAINDALRLCPWADTFYSGARNYWLPRTVPGRMVAAFPGLKVRICLDQDRPGIGADGVVRLRVTGHDGLETVPNGLKTYQNSGGAAINLAVHLGASRIVLLGYDMGPAPDGRHHFHETARTPHGSPYALFRKLIATMVPALAALGVAVVNASRVSQLPCFPRVALETEFP